MIAAMPLTLAVTDSKIRWRSRDRTASAATKTAPKSAPATSELKKTVVVPRPRRFTMPVSPPMYAQLMTTMKPPRPAIRNAMIALATVAVSSTRTR